MGRYIWKTINGEYCTVQDKVDGIIVTTKVAFHRLYEYEQLGPLGRFAQLTAENKELRDQLAALQAENAEKDKEIERLKSELLEAREDHMASEAEREQGLAALTRVKAERDRYKQKYEEIGAEYTKLRTDRTFGSGAQGEG